MSKLPFTFTEQPAPTPSLASLVAVYAFDAACAIAAAVGAIIAGSALATLAYLGISSKDVIFLGHFGVNNFTFKVRKTFADHRHVNV